jgi:serine/threonine protein phosphatase PrpC
MDDAVTTPPAPSAPTAQTTCPTCHAVVGDSEQFCEACGAGLSPTVVEAEPPPVEPLPVEVSTLATPVPDDLSGTSPTCPACGGEVASDGYCGTCGARAPRLRDHFSEQPAAWVAAVCDRGIRHGRNEDAVALMADTEPGSRAVLVVCDGVSSSVDSDLASLAAARAARDVLAASHSRGLGTESSLLAAVIARLKAATDAALAAVLAVTVNDVPANDVAAAGDPGAGDPGAGDPPAEITGADMTAEGNPASCTFVAAVVERDLLVVGSVGDSRAYWFPDSGPPIALSIDDSFAQEQIASGVPRAQAETGPQAHAITRWLGVDAPPHTPKTTTMKLVEPGWLMVCSDGLWNYCSAAQDLAALVARTSGTSPAAAEPLALAGALVDWANAQGGRDNISVALARIDPD